MREPLDSALVAFVESVEAEDVPRWHELSVEEARRLEADLFTPDESAMDTVGAVAETSVTEPETGVDVPVRAYVPASVGPHPVMVFCHGGGWMLGTLDSADDLCRGLCRRTDHVVVSVDYRLAPEHPFPAGLTDAIAVLEWCRRDPDALPETTGRLVVAGTSAGGNLAAGLAMYSVDADDAPSVDHQLLLYPMLDDSLDYPSYVVNADAPFLSTADVAWFWDNYRRHAIDSAHPYAVPMIEADRDDLPSATVATAGHDPLRDEGVRFAERLGAAGGSVEHHHQPSLCHGFLSMADDVPRADEAFDEIATSLD